MRSLFGEKWSGPWNSGVEREEGRDITCRSAPACKPCNECKAFRKCFKMCCLILFTDHASRGVLPVVRVQKVSIRKGLPCPEFGAANLARRANFWMRAHSTGSGPAAGSGGRRPCEKCQRSNGNRRVPRRHFRQVQRLTDRRSEVEGHLGFRKGEFAVPVRRRLSTFG
jgi:hypothetical protein